MAGGNFTSVPLPVAHRLLHPKLVAIIVAVDTRGRPNGMTAAWITPISINPPMICVAISPTRYTYELIRTSKEFTVNVLDSQQVKTSHYFGTVSGRYEDKFAQSGVRLAQSTSVRAPHLVDALAVLECKLEKEFKLGDHALVIGRIANAYAREGVFTQTYNPEKAKVLLHLGGDDYVTIADEMLKP